MKRLQVLLLTATILLPTSSLRAQNSNLVGVYNTPVVCNDGRININAVRAFKDTSGIFNRWVIDGWYPVHPGECDAIGPEEHYVGGGLFFESSVTLLAFALDSIDGGEAVRVRDSTGGLFKPSNQQICVENGGFRYTRDESQGDPAKECDRGLPGYYRIPVSLEFEGDTYSVFNRASGDLYFHVRDERDFLHVSFGPSDRANHPFSPMTARLIFGDEVHLDEGGQWRYPNGSAIPTELIVKKTGLPVLLPRRQYSTSQSPVQGYIKEIKDVMNSVHACTDTSFLNTRHSPSDFDMDNFGVVMATNTTAVFGSEPVTSLYGAALANLDLTSVTLQSRGECYLVSFTCKDSGQCVRLGDSASVIWSLFVNTKEQGDRIVNALRAIAPYYPDGTGEIH